MLEKIRDGSHGVITKIILGLIILSFLMTGIGSYLYQKEDLVLADVNGQEIRTSKFLKMYQQQSQQIKERYGDLADRILEDPAQKESIKKEVLQRLVDTEMLLSYARKHNLIISDRKIAEELVSIPEFLTDGKFNSEKYIKVLRRAGLKAEDFKKSLSEELQARQFVNGLATSNYLLDSDTWSIEKLILQNRKFSYKLFNAKDYLDQVVISDDEIKQYYEAHQERFILPERYQFSYIDISVDSLKKDLKLTKEEIQDYYDAHPESFKTEEKRYPAHIYISNDSKSDINEILNKLTKDPSLFARLAIDFSEDRSSSTNGGKLSWVAFGEMPSSFNDALFELKEGEISQVIESDSGKHIIKLIGIKKAELIPLTEIQSSIRSTLLNQKAESKYANLKQQLSDITYEQPNDLISASKTLGLPIQLSNYMSQSNLTGLFSNIESDGLLFVDEVVVERLNSQVIDLSTDSAIVVNLNDKIDAGVDTLENASLKIKDILTTKRATELAKQKATQALSLINEKGKKDASFKHVDIDRFNSNASINSEILEKVFELPKTLTSKRNIDLIEIKEGYAVVELISVTEFDESKRFNNETTKMSIQSRLDYMFSMTLKAYLRENNDIKIYENRLRKI